MNFYARGGKTPDGRELRGEDAMRECEQEARLAHERLLEYLKCRNFLARNNIDTSFCGADPRNTEWDPYPDPPYDPWLSGTAGAGQPRPDSQGSEAEDMEYGGSCNSIKPGEDAYMSSLRTVAMYCNGGVHRWPGVYVPFGATKVTVRYWPQYCRGWPKFSLYIGDRWAMSDVEAVGSDSYQPWYEVSAPISRPAGTQYMYLWFGNDYYESPSCDRNLCVDRIEFSR